MNQFRLPTKSELIEPHMFLEEVLKDELQCPGCGASTNDGATFMLKLSIGDLVIPVRRLKQGQRSIWHHDKQHWGQAELVVVRCAKCHKVGEVSEFLGKKERERLPMIHVKVLKISEKWTLVSIKNKSFYVLTMNTARNVEEGSDGIVVGISLREVADKAQIDSPDVFLRKS
jgi:hypothetical protein